MAWSASRASPAQPGDLVQNVGAYGVEVADSLTWVLLLDRRTFEVCWAPAAELEFGYRHSVLKNSDAALVLEVEFALDQAGRLLAPLRYGELSARLGVAAGDTCDPAQVRAEVLALRAGKGMVLDAADHDTWSVGSSFTNPVVPVEQFDRLQDATEGTGSALPGPGRGQARGRLAMERAGFGKGYPGHGPCRCPPTRAKSTGGARTADAITLARTVRDGGHRSFLPERFEKFVNK